MDSDVKAHAPVSELLDSGGTTARRERAHRAACMMFTPHTGGDPIQAVPVDAKAGSASRAWHRNVALHSLRKVSLQPSAEHHVSALRIGRYGARTICH